MKKRSWRAERRKKQKERLNSWRSENWRINTYVCSRGHITTTVDVAEGVTPFAIDCKGMDCQEMAHSSFYPQARPIPEHIRPPAFEWYKPDEEEMPNLHPAEREHVKAGGLLMRERTATQPICHT